MAGNYAQTISDRTGLVLDAYFSATKLAWLLEYVQQLLKVDGSACQNNFLMQFQADVLEIRVERPIVFDATAQGAAFGAGLAIGFWQDYAAFVASRQIEQVFYPGQSAAATQANFITWQKAVERVLSP